MLSHSYKLIFFLCCIHFGCLGATKNDPKLQEAFEIHKQSLDVAKQSKALLNNLERGDANRVLFDAQLKQWQENIIEVPGFEHDHDHDHDHHHHNVRYDLSPEDMLEVQKEMLDSIQAIQIRIRKFDSGTVQ